jgi:Vam6/Vps39-like protein vacuolar protein sorting-associated protein 39
MHLLLFYNHHYCYSIMTIRSNELIMDIIVAKSKECVLRCMAEKRRNNQVVSNLLKTEQLKVHENYIKATSRSIMISEDNKCPVCNWPIGDSAFACYPNGVVVHYRCCSDKFVCPVTKRRFNAL